MYRERRQRHPAQSGIESRRQVGALIDVGPRASAAGSSAMTSMPAPGQERRPMSMPSWSGCAEKSENCAVTFRDADGGGGHRSPGEAAFLSSKRRRVGK